MEFNYDTLRVRMRELAFLNKGLRITIEDERTNQKHDYHFEGGIVSFVKYLNKNKQLLHEEPIYFYAERAPPWRSRCSTTTRTARTIHVCQQHPHARGRHAPDGLKPA